MSDRWCAWLGWKEELDGSGFSAGMAFLAVGNRIRAAEEALSGTDLVMLAGDDAVQLWNCELTEVQLVEVVFVDQSPVTDE